jgi:Rod binding domain-containing protein
MRNGEDSWGGDKDSADGSSDTISSFGTEAMAKAISQGGGFGIAKQVVAQVSREYDRSTKKNN